MSDTPRTDEAAGLPSIDWEVTATNIFEESRKLAELKQALNQQLQDAVEALKLCAAVIGSPNDGEWKSVDECNAAFDAAIEVIRAAKGEQP
jgi:hypothetical protein